MQGVTTFGKRCSKSIFCICMIFRVLLYGMRGSILLKFHLICMRIDEVTGAGTYKYDNIFSNLSMGDTYREEFRFFILPGTDINYQITFRKHSDILPYYLQASKTALDQKLQYNLCIQRRIKYIVPGLMYRSKYCDYCHQNVKACRPNIYLNLW